MYVIELYNRFIKDTFVYRYITKEDMYSAFEKVKKDYIIHSTSFEPTGIFCQVSPKGTKEVKMNVGRKRH